MKKKPKLLFFLSILFFGLSACATTPESIPNAWIDHPRDGAIFAPGETVMIMSHGFAKKGVSEVVLSINGEAYRRDVPADAGQDFVSLQQDWVTGEAGIYTIQVQVYDQQGQVGDPAMISVEVIGDVQPEAPTAANTPTLVPTGVPTNTPTLVPTLVATATFTPVPIIPSDTPTSPPPADTTPPPVPSPAVPANGLELTCRATQTLVWLPVTDPSGIDGYYVKLEREVSGNWQSAGGYGPVSGKQVDVTVECGIRYRWMVRAEDGAGNYSGWSAPSTFSVLLN